MSTLHRPISSSHIQKSSDGEFTEADLLRTDDHDATVNAAMKLQVRSPKRELEAVKKNEVGASRILVLENLLHHAVRMKPRYESDYRTAQREKLILSISSLLLFHAWYANWFFLLDFTHSLFFILFGACPSTPLHARSHPHFLPEGSNPSRRHFYHRRCRHPLPLCRTIWPIFTISCSVSWFILFIGKLLISF